MIGKSHLWEIHLPALNTEDYLVTQEVSHAWFISTFLSALADCQTNYTFLLTHYSIFPCTLKPNSKPHTNNYRIRNKILDKTMECNVSYSDPPLSMVKKLHYKIPWKVYECYVHTKGIYVVSYLMFTLYFFFAISKSFMILLCFISQICVIFNVFQTEKSDDVFPYLDSGDIKKEDLKKEYDVPSSLIMKEDKHELGDDVVMNSPKPLQAKSDAGHDLNMSVDEHNQHNLKVSDTEHMNMSVDEASMHKVLTPLSKKTPKSVHTPQTPLQNSDRVIAEEMLISPDSSRPIITTEAKQSISGFSAVRNLVSRQDHSSKLNSTILSNLIDTPDTDTSTKSSVSSTGSNSPERVPKMLTEDSPIARDNRSKLSKRLVIQDLPEKSESEEEDKSLNQSIKLDASVLVDSVLEESMEQDSEEKFSTTGKRYSISKSHRNTGLEKISNVNEHENDNSLPDINTDTEAKSELQDEDEDMLPVLDNPVQLKSVEDSNLLPDLDSPVLPRSMNKAKPSKKYVMESSDENSDNEKLDEKTVNDTNDFSDTLDRGEKTDSSAEVDDIGNKEIVNSFIEDKADTDEEHEDGSDVENGDSTEEETEYSGEEESSEEETDADEEEGLQGNYGRHQIDDRCRN